MESIEILDIVLTMMSNNPFLISPDASDGQIGHEILKKFPELNHDRFGSDLLRILSKLKKEGYIDSHPRPFNPKEGEDQINYYFITFDGQFFSKKGGYKKQEEEKIKAEEYQIRQSRLLASYQKWVVIGTLVAASYYAKELIVWFFGGHTPPC